jgi:hypothetical protein
MMFTFQVRRLVLNQTVLHPVNYQEELPLNAFEAVSRGYFYFEIPWYSDLTTLNSSIALAANERYDPDSNVFYAATLLEYLRRIHRSPLSTLLSSARTRSYKRREKSAIKPAAKLRGNRAREQIANHAPPPHEKQETSSTLSTASSITAEPVQTSRQR